MNILFVCSMAKLRSKTAAHTLKAAWNDIRYAGTDKDADLRVTIEDILWADVIVCMENKHKSKLRRMIKGQSGKMQVWKIPDEYCYMDDKLVHLLRVKSENLLEDFG